MDNRQEKQKWFSIYAMLLMMLLAVISLQYLLYLKVIPEPIASWEIIHKLSSIQVNLFVKTFYVIMMPFLTSMYFNVNVAQSTKEGEKKFYIVFYIILSVIIFIGPVHKEIFYFYNVIFLPIVLSLHVFASSRGFAKVTSELKDQVVIGFSKQPIDTIGGIKLEVIEDETGKEDYITIHNPYQGIFVSGGAGAGKSASLVVPIMNQWIRQGMSMTIYDFKGDPATLGKFAYESWLYHKDKNEASKFGFKYPDFKLISLAEIHKSIRPNPMDPDLIESQEHMQGIIYAFLSAINPEHTNNSKGGQAFWLNAAFILCLGIAERLRRNYPSYCTFAHLIAISTLEIADVQPWMEKNVTVRRKIVQYKSAEGAPAQLGGMVSSLQGDTVKLLSEKIIYLFGAKKEDQSSLDVNDPENPLILSISDDVKLEGSGSIMLSVILGFIKRIANQQKKHPHMVVVDEYPRVFFPIDDLPATGRSNKVSTLVAAQDLKQIIDKYGKDKAQILIANLGSQFYGMSNDVTTSDEVVKLFGQVKIKDTSYTYTEDGVQVSERLQLENAIQVRDVAGQEVGHFLGKIAGGKPALFSGRFKYWDPSKEINEVDEIPINNLQGMAKKLYERDPEKGLEVFNSYVRIEFERVLSEAYQIVSGAIKEEKEDY